MKRRRVLTGSEAVARNMIARGGSAPPLASIRAAACDSIARTRDQALTTFLGGDSLSRLTTAPQPTADGLPRGIPQVGAVDDNLGRLTTRFPTPPIIKRATMDDSSDLGRDLETATPHDSPAAKPTAHVVLYQPEIPQNTGNIGRTCVAVDAKLWIVRPAAFRLDDARLRRAGLDYWQHLRLGDAVNWDNLTEQLSGRRFFFFSRFARKTIWQAQFEPGDVFVFGRETAGLPDTLLDPQAANSLRLPMSPHVRSLNLATTVGIVLYEHQRQLSLHAQST
jgi:tRNA (cytidine/uridine-2'-O-)-methyltransferase